MTTTRQTTRPSITRNPGVARLAAGVGIAVHLGGVFVYILIPGLVVPFPALYAFYGAWLLVLGASLRWYREHPWRTSVVPVVGVGIAAAARLAGERLLGWAP